MSDYTPFKMIFQGIVTAELTFASTKACLRQKGGWGVFVLVAQFQQIGASLAEMGARRAKRGAISALAPRATYPQVIHNFLHLILDIKLSTLST